MVLAILVAAILTLVVGWGPARNQLVLSTTRRPTPYTELYFADFRGLPVVVRPSQAYPFEFVVVNHTGRDELYTVTAGVATSTGSTTLSRMTFGLHDGGRAQRTVTFTPAAHNRYVLTISLGNGEAIHWAVVAA